MRDLNYKHLHYFWVVAKEGGVNRAANKLGVAAQTISGQLALLERSLGVALFAPAGRGLALTEAGRGFDTHIGTFLNKPMPETTCVFCGQCVGVCPTNALKPVKAWELEQAEATA